jgi:3-methyladenine DNA glycosylase AlkD
VQKALGSWLREAGKVDEDALVAFLQAHGDTLPKTTMTSATAKLSPARRERLRKLA